MFPISLFFFLFPLCVSHIVLPDAVTIPVAGVCATYTYFTYTAVSYCLDVRISVQSMNSSGIGGIVVTSGTNQEGETKEINPYPTLTSNGWAVGEGEQILLISTFEMNFRAGLFFIGVYVECGNDPMITDWLFNITAQAVTPIVTESSDPVVTIGSNNQYALQVPEAYNYFQFCVDSPCADVSFTFSGCSDPTVCPSNYASPIILASKTKPKPAYRDFSWSYASNFTIDHDDPLAGPGRYYGTLFSWCNPEQYCSDPAICYPCSSYQNGVSFNFSINVTPLPLFNCVMRDVIPALAPGGAAITPVNISTTSFLFQTVNNGALSTNGGVFNQSMVCSGNTQTYYSFDLVNPCLDVNISLWQTQGQANLIVSRAPVYYPSYSSAGWMDYWWGNNYVILSHTDSDYVAPARYYVLVTGYCTADSSTFNNQILYDLTITTQKPSNVDRPLTSTPLLDSVGAGAYKYYHFCLPTTASVNLTMTLPLQGDFTSSSAQSNSNYTSPEIIVSLSTEEPLISSLGFRMNADILNPETNNSLAQATAVFTGIGHFFVAVYGRCYPNGSCSSLEYGACAPCSNYPSSYYLTLNYVTNKSVVIASNVVNSSTGWSDGAFAGIAVGMFLIGIFATLIIGYFWLRNSFPTPQPSENHFEKVEFSTA